MRTGLMLLALQAVVANAPETPALVFRDASRPVYQRTVSPQEMAALAARGALIIDVRLPEDFASNPVLIEGAVYRNPERLSQWAGELPKDRPIVVYCVKGAWVSQKVAAFLHGQKRDVYSLAGGQAAWNASRIPAQLPN